MNSKFLLITVFKNLKCCFKNRGYCWITYIRHPATTALSSFVSFICTRRSRSMIVVISRRRSSSSLSTPLMEPIDQISGCSESRKGSLAESCIYLSEDAPTPTWMSK